MFSMLNYGISCEVQVGALIPQKKESGCQVLQSPISSCHFKLSQCQISFFNQTSLHWGGSFLAKHKKLESDTPLKSLGESLLEKATRYAIQSCTLAISMEKYLSKSPGSPVGRAFAPREDGKQDVECGEKSKACKSFIPQSLLHSEELTESLDFKKKIKSVCSMECGRII